MRLIDADALEAKLEKQRKLYIEMDMKGAEDLLVHDVLHYVWEAPTIDAVQVIRCKDCFLYGECQAAKFYGDDGYCSVGEREDDDKSCDTCKYYDDDWCSGACDSCIRNQSYWERKDNEID